MNNVNYDKEMEKILSSIKKEKIKPKLLMHACCAPCASASLLRIKDYFDVTLYFYNPNMDGIEEYRKRANELVRLAEIIGVKYIIEDFAPSDFFTVVQGLEDCAEGGKRCKECFKLRLNKTANKAKEGNFDYFTTTLTLSPLKNAETLNTIGIETAEKYGVKLLPSDFKKKGGYQLSVMLSKEYGLYRQNYCGCIFSKKLLP